MKHLKMWAVLRDGEIHMVLPDLERAEAHYGSLSLNGLSKHRWKIRPVEVRATYETAGERRKRLNRHVQAVVELNRAMSR